ncbi:MAG: FAD-binding oxidoreductase [Chloroflexi bacterium]|nr:FAD-binding oxidoreductase [Chloroflexota bacterium]
MSMVKTSDPARVRNQLEQALGSSFIPGAGINLGTAYPASEDELRELVLHSRELGVAVAARGASSSPFDGPPPRPVLTVGTSRLNRILEVDGEVRVARVEAGVVWRDLIKALEQRGLMPRVYPSSEAFSTVGGFVAQGGVGAGSFEFGSIDESVIAVRLMTAAGDIRDVDGEGLDLVIGAEGRTGIILQIVLKVQPHSNMYGLVAAFNSARDVELCIAEVARQALPLWSLSLLDRSAVDLQARLGRATHPVPLGRYAAMFSLREQDQQQVLPRLRGEILATGGRLLDVNPDQDSWVPYFMGLQSLPGPATPMHFRLPLGQFGAFVQALPDGLRRILGFEGVVADTARCLTLRLFFTEEPENEAAAAEIARALLTIAKEHGGQVYATGAPYLDQAEDVYGERRLHWLRALHGMVDPDDRLNPGHGFTTVDGGRG